MANYRIYTDSGCDIKPELLKEWGVGCSSLTFRFNGEDKEYSNNDMSTAEFYDRMRQGGIAKTAAINVDGFAGAFRPILEGGEDILYLGFSTGLSTTYNSARLAAQALSAEFPDRKIITVDTLAASAGQGLVVYLTREGKVRRNNRGGCRICKEHYSLPVPLVYRR